jgi:hypothetical protein
MIKTRYWLWINLTNDFATAWALSDLVLESILDKWLSRLHTQN